MSSEKIHKRMSVQILKHLTHWIETSKFDYSIVDLDRCLQEAKQHYIHYINIKEDENYKPNYEIKSYK